MARNRAKFIEQKFCAIRDRVSDLTSPLCVRVRGRLFLFVRSGRGGIFIDLHIVVRGEVGND